MTTFSRLIISQFLATKQSSTRGWSSLVHSTRELSQLMGMISRSLSDMTVHFLCLPLFHQTHAPTLNKQSHAVLHLALSLLCLFLLLFSSRALIKLSNFLNSSMSLMPSYLSSPFLASVCVCVFFSFGNSILFYLKWYFNQRRGLKNYLVPKSDVPDIISSV